jgi:tetratricopeptide (TPR) repeat protein
MTHRPLLALLLALAALGAGCKTSSIQRSPEVPSRIEPEEVPGAIAAAEEALLADRPQLAMDWMRVASTLEGLPSDQRVRVQRLLEISADRFIAEVERDERAAEVLSEVLDLELPRQVAVTGALRGAQLYQAREEPWEAVKVVQAVDKRYPTHHLRPEAGRLLVECGLTLSELPSGWFSSNRDNAYAALEYVSVHYPAADRGDEALMRLAEMYEEDRRFDLAIGRHEELTTNDPESPLLPYSLARIPHLKLAAIASPEYDRRAVLEARRDLERWLADYPGHPVAEAVEYDLVDALVRLTVSDLGVARFYARIDNPAGVRYPAERARREAEAAGDAGLVARADALLAELPPAEGLPR